MSTVTTEPGKRNQTSVEQARPRRGIADSSVWTALGLSAVLVWLVVVAFTFRDYGITWDEDWQRTNGENILNWYRSLFQDRAALEYRNMMYYGGLFDLLAQSLWRFSPLGEFETRHLLNVAFGAAGVLIALWLAGWLESRLAGLLAAVMLVLTPAWYGHSFNNPKDVPFAVLYMLSLFLIVRMIKYMPRVPWWRVVLTGLAIGLALAVRIGGILLLSYLGIAFLLWLAHASWQQRRLQTDAIVPFGLRFLCVTAVAWLAMLPWWPFAQVDPVRHPVRALRVAASFQTADFNVLFEGRDIHTSDLPWYFTSKMWLLTMPEFVLLGGALAIGLAGAAFARRHRQNAEQPPRVPGGIEELAPGITRPRNDTVHAWRGGRPGRVIPWVIIAFAIVFPVAWSAASGAVVYDGIRHFLFVVPLIVVAGAVGFAALLRMRRPLGLAALVVVVLSMGITASDMIRLHPNQYIFYNRSIAGGVAKAAESYELDYWGNSYKEGAEWLPTRYGPGDQNNPWRVATCSYPLSTAHFLAPGYKYVGRDANPDVFLASRRWHCDRRLSGRVVHTVTRMGAPLLIVKEISARAAAASR